MGKIIDLTLSYNDKIAHYDWKVSREIDKDGWYAHDLQIYSHAGTHMDAPIHFGVNDTTIDQITPERFISDCWVVDLIGCAPGHLITVNDLGEIKKKFVAGDSILIATGWSKYLGQDRYRNALPRISADLADWMAEKKVNMVLVEPPSVADPNNKEEVTMIHRKLLGGDVIIVEGICNTDLIAKRNIRILALPLKIEQGDGAPTRVLAILD